MNDSDREYKLRRTRHYRSRKVRAEDAEEWIGLWTEHETIGFPEDVPDRFLKLAATLDLSAAIDRCQDNEREWRTFRLRLEALQNNQAKTCAYCGENFYARKGAIYCSPSCMAQASRQRKKSPRT